MNRVFAAAAFADLLLLAGAAVLGATINGDHRYAQHFSLGLFASLFTALLHVVVFTYFSATGRMISQAVWIGHLDRGPLDSVRDFKSRVIRWVAAGFGSIVVVASLGAVCARDPTWRLWHAAASILAITVNAVAFYAQHGCIHRNMELMTTVFEAYDAEQAGAQDQPKGTPQPSTGKAESIKIERADPERTSRPG